MEKTGLDIHYAKEVIESGGLVIFPTETVYGLGANALNKEAVSKIFKAKERPSYDPLIVHIHSLNQLDDVVSYFPENAQKLADKFWPGPLTIILPKSDKIPYEVTSGMDTVGIRIPSHKIARDFLETVNLPIAGPSANKFGYISPTQSSHLGALLDSVDYIIEGGDCKIGLESTIVSLVGEPVILRMGAITKTDIEEIIGNVNIEVNSSSNPMAPGMLERHYAPQKKLEIYSEGKNYPINSVFIGFGGNLPKGYGGDFVNLSANGDSMEAASKLYKTLRDLDNSNYNLLLISYLPKGELNDAINDKIKRASTK